jgi:DUF4097 and DUF4098 domain-containing protein YvlB
MSSPTRTHSDPDRISLWVVLALGLLVLALAVATRAEDFPSRASRTQTFNATGKIRSLSIENINGDVSVTAGPQFAASVEITARARSQSLAKKALDDTTVAFENRDGELTLLTEEPGSRVRRSGRRWNVQVRRDDGQFRVEARYTITLPADAELSVSAVNGNVSARGISAATEISTVNGNAEVDGARRDLAVRSVNGNITASCAEVARGAQVSSETVNGNIKLRLPPSAGFQFSGHTMSGEIVTTFPLPPADHAERRAGRVEARAEKERLRAEQDKLRREMRDREKARRAEDGGFDVEVDLSELNQAMEELGREMGRMGEEIARSVTENLNRAYTGTVNGGGSSVKCSTLNGRISLLAAGSDEARATSLVGPRGGPHPAAPRPPAPPRAPRSPRPPRPPAGGEEEGSVVRGDVAGDFELTLPFGDVEVGKVAGGVRINTHGGEITVQEAGKTADLTSSGGEIRIESARGDLKCLTYGGDLTVGSVAGNATLRTVGGDISLRSGGGAVVAKTGGGDIALTHVHGPATAETGGGNVTCEIFARETAGGVSIVSGAGDVTVTLPANFRADVEVSVCGVDSEEDYVSSQFPEISVSKKGSRFHGTQSASGKLNGGGPRVVIRTSSGRVTLKKGPAA